MVTTIEIETAEQALADHLECDVDEIIHEYDNNGHIYSHGTDEYIVADDADCDELWKESIDSYIDDCVLPEIPEAYQSYFDNEAFFEACKMDGRAHSLATYDGDEHWIADFYIYRIN